MKRIARDVDASKYHKQSARYLLRLIDHCDPPLTPNQAAARIGVSRRMMRYYLCLDPGGGRPIPYTVQATLEALADWSEQEGEKNV